MTVPDVPGIVNSFSQIVQLVIEKLLFPFFACPSRDPIPDLHTNSLTDAGQISSQKGKDLVCFDNLSVNVMALV